MSEVGDREELGRIRRVADMLCTAHANLRDRFARYALMLDVAILWLSAWLTALAFVEPTAASFFTPKAIRPEHWIGMLGVAVFALSLFQMKTDWKARSDAHKRTFDLYAEVKREAGYLLADRELEQAGYRRVLSRYDMASAAGIALPERDFLRQKRLHLLKVLASRNLDQRPGMSIALFYVRIWLRDNFWK